MNAFLKTRTGLIAALIVFGATWGLTIPLMKIAVSTGYQQFGLIFWEFAITTVYLGIVAGFKGRFPKITRDHLIVFVVIALLGTVIASSFSFIVIRHIPAGVYSVVISLVPMFALPIAIMMRLEHFEWHRAVGIVLGLCAILVLVGPDASLPDPSKAGYVLLACIAPLCYGLEDNFVGKFTLRGLTPVQALLGASIVGLIIMAPVSVATGQWFSLNRVWGPPEWAILFMSLLHGFAYTGYVWLIGRAGPVFAAQVAYLVTGFAVLWSIILLDETYSVWVWLALGLMMAGLFLVQPKGEDHP
ncbi:MAG: DMT family transporter [Proteobacteria bacterium]|nr:DMT family transporter [Pseudomonadota bacterium]